MTSNSLSPLASPAWRSKAWSAWLCLRIDVCSPSLIRLVTESSPSSANYSLDMDTLVCLLCMALWPLWHPKNTRTRDSLMPHVHRNANFPEYLEVNSPSMLMWSLTCQRVWIGSCSHSTPFFVFIWLSYSRFFFRSWTYLDVVPPLCCARIKLRRKWFSAHRYISPFASHWTD